MTEFLGAGHPAGSPHPLDTPWGLALRVVGRAVLMVWSFFTQWAGAEGGPSCCYTGSPQGAGCRLFTPGGRGLLSPPDHQDVRSKKLKVRDRRGL